MFGWKTKDEGEGTETKDGMEKLDRWF